MLPDILFYKIVFHTHDGKLQFHRAWSGIDTWYAKSSLTKEFNKLKAELSQYRKTAKIEVHQYSIVDNQLSINKLSEYEN